MGRWDDAGEGRLYVLTLCYDGVFIMWDVMGEGWLDVNGNVINDGARQGMFVKMQVYESPLES
jgi:hypothetical protein